MMFGILASLDRKDRKQYDLNQLLIMNPGLRIDATESQSGKGLHLPATLRLFELLADQVALWTDDIAAKAMTDHLADAFRNPRLAVHKGVHIQRVEREQAHAGDRGCRRRATRPPQHRNLAEELAGPQ